MTFNIEEEPPLLKSSTNKIVKQTKTAHKAVFSFVKKNTKSLYLVVPTILIVTSVVVNMLSSKSYAMELSDYVVMNPNSKINAMRAIDRYTDIIEESRDAEPIVLADVVADELVLTKPNITSTKERPEEEELKRDRVIVHTVSAGETLSTIAQSYGVNMASIQVENKDLNSVDSLSIGDKLRIPPQNYSSDYIAKVAKTNTKIAYSNTDSRNVIIRESSSERFTDSGQPIFNRAAGALGANGYHSWAIDIPPSGGTAIYASAAGVVTEVTTGWNGGYGTKILIDHGSGWQTLYAHLSSVNVSAGARVSQGQVIATMGATGRCYPKGAVHLHFEIIKNGVRQNPLNYVQ